MRTKGLPTVAAAIVAVGLVVVGATARPAPSADLSPSVPTALSPALQQLITTGVLPTDVTGEPGVWSYTGPTCPGPGWVCSPPGAFSVTQSATVDVDECVDPNSCVGIVQTADVNVAKCEQKVQATAAFVRQLCEITQTGQDNQATVVQLIEQTGAATQGALQEAVIKQTGNGSTNQLQVDQEIKQFSENGQNKDQDAYQVVKGPDAVVVGNVTTFPATQTQTPLTSPVFNQAQIDQKQIQRAKGGTIQTQNDGAYGTGAPFDEPDDCDPLNNPPDPHACVNLVQDSEGGNNQSQLSQSIDEEASTAVIATLQSTVTQQQGVTPVDTNPDPVFEFLIFPGGVDGRVHQETTAPGSSQNQANQSKTQNAFAPPGSTQRQFDPGGCCGFGTIIGPGSDQIAQVGKQHASEDEALQTIMLTGVSNGTAQSSCAIAQTGHNNADESSGSFTQDPCFFLIVETVCTNPPPPPPIEGPATPACTTQEVEFD